jgi:hypothetical protein
MKEDLNLTFFSPMQRRLEHFKSNSSKSHSDSQKCQNVFESKKDLAKILHVPCAFHRISSLLHILLLLKTTCIVQDFFSRLFFNVSGGICDCDLKHEKCIDSVHVLRWKTVLKT